MMGRVARISGVMWAVDTYRREHNTFPDALQMHPETLAHLSRESHEADGRLMDPVKLKLAGIPIEIVMDVPIGAVYLTRRDIYGGAADE